MNSSLDNTEPTNLRAQLVTNAPWLALVITALGISYSAGQHQVISGGYLLTFSYADTLFQFYNVCRQIALVLLATITVVLVLAIASLIVGYLKLVAERVFLPILFRIRQSRQTRKISRRLDEIEVLTVSLAYSRNPRAKSTEQLQRLYVATKRWQKSGHALEQSQRRYMASIDNLLLLKPSEGPADERFTTQFVAQWWRENKHKRRYLIPYLFVTTPILITIALVVSLRTDTIFESWVFAACSYALLLLIMLVGARMKTAEGTPTASDNTVGIIISAVSLATFMFLLGRDDVEAAIVAQEIYCVSFQNDEVKCGKYAASNSSVVVIFNAEGESSYTIFPWNSIKSARYGSLTSDSAEEP